MKYMRAFAVPFSHICDQDVITKPQRAQDDADTELPEARRHTLQSPDLPDTVHVTGAQAIAIWPDVLDHDTLRDWVRHGRIQPTSDTPRQYPLAVINTLTTALAHKRNT